jgi:Resolvase, N terminal domain
VDRFTRSLAYFATLVELFDAHAVSFVSVTQQFNTTSSMGRLTLNVLLSFAQFEREVTGERIRDKIAASKRKGIWIGGNVPLGYESRDKKLVIHEGEAERVRTIFRRLLARDCHRWLVLAGRGIIRRPSRHTCGLRGQEEHAATHKLILEIQVLIGCPVQMTRARVPMGQLTEV